MSFGDPFLDIYSKKLGLKYSGLGAALEGAKIEGIRYGSVEAFPEEIEFSEDSLYSEFVGYTVNTVIKNTSDYDVVLDSIVSIGGCLGDALNLPIISKDSIKISIYDVDLCPVCKRQPNEYFEDTLRFVSTFNGSNNYSFYKTIRISGEGHPSDVTDDKDLPSEFVLEQNYPNPFNPSTTIKYSIPFVISTEGRNLNVTLKVYDVLGKEVATLINEEKSAGSYKVEFNASNLPAGRQGLSSGVYYYQL